LAQIFLSNKLLKTFFAAVGLAATACGTPDQQQQVPADEMTLAVKDGTDIEQALIGLPKTTVLGVNESDRVPFMIKGNFGVATGSAKGLSAADAKATVQTALSKIASVFRLRVEDLAFKKVNVDDLGHQHLRFVQMKDGLPVANAELMLHVDKAGNVYAANGNARDTQGVTMGLVMPQIAADAAAVAANKATDALDKAAKVERLVYVRDLADNLVLAHEIRVTGRQIDGLPVEDLVYINATNGKVALRNSLVRTAKNRAVYSANNGTSLPGTLKRSEGGAASGDNHVDQNYNKLGDTYDCYSVNFGRDSYNAAGAQLKSSVHYSTNYTNAYWNSTQMVYGDSDGVQSAPLGLSLDVTVHELTHAVTENESNLTYSGESGGLNEGMSDIFGAYCQSWKDGGGSTTTSSTWPTTNSVFMVGDDVWTPNTANDALRYMYDPAADGASKDYWVSGVGNVDVHYSSGIANLAFTLLSKGGTHPRGKSTIVVPAIGVQKAGKIFYEANANCAGPSTNYLAFKQCTIDKATLIHGAGSAEVDATTKAWEAVGVGGAPPPPPPTITLSNGVPVTGIGDSAGNNKYYKLTVPANQTTLTFATTGGTGDVDLYVRKGAAPDSATYDCRPYTAGNAETCNITPDPAGADYYVMLNAYSTYSGVTLTGTYSGGGGGGTPKTDTKSGSVASGVMVQVSNYSGLTAGSTFKVTMTGTGDPDLYVRWGAAPTTTTYTCRPYLSGASETCTLTVPSGTTSAYVAVRGFTAATYSLTINYTSSP
jgi:Zn-dependent metalloprotease